MNASLRKKRNPKLLREPGALRNPFFPREPFALPVPPPRGGGEQAAL